ncbi:MAG TPA: transposase [Ktedonobacteraceae bacterium]
MSELFMVVHLLVPILGAAQEYGLKKSYLQPFRKQIDEFYKRVIENKVYHSELTNKYQHRFQRFRHSLFTFIEHDGIPWHNNTAEGAIRHLAIQRKISTFFFKSGATYYLVLLGITQTCRFQRKSLLQFLLSGEKDIDQFQATVPLESSVSVSSPTHPNQ